MGIRSPRNRPPNPSLLIEPLETRSLLAGVTLISHGFDDNTTGWVLLMAKAIAARAGGDSAVSVYTLEIGLDSNKKVAPLAFYADVNSPAYGTASSGETIVKLDWSTVSLGNYSTILVGDVAAQYLMEAHGSQPALADEPIHLIGHSRGASLNTEIARDLGKHGVWVNQFTSLDPVQGGGDEPMATFSNTLFADDYWRTSTGDISGQAVAGAYLQSLENNVQNHSAGEGHQGPHTYYYGTINLTGTYDGWPVYDSWYNTAAGFPARNSTGFYFSTIAGGKRPASGIAAAFGGTASRVDPGKTGTQWPEVDSIHLAGHTTINAGQSLNVHFTRESRGGASQTVIFLDPDRNPFDGNSTRIGRQKFRTTAVPTPTARDAVTTGVKPGTYYVGVMATDATGLTRYAYAAKRVVIH